MGRNPIRQRPTAPVRMLSLRWHYPNQVTRVEGGTLLSACHTSSPTIYLYTPILYTHCLTNTSLAGGNFGGRWSLLGPPQGGPCGVVSRPVPGGGSRLSLEKARTQRVAGEGPRQVVRVWTSAGPGLQRGSPPDSGREPGFLQRKPEERAPGAMPPGPPFLWPARWHSLVLAWWGAAERLLGYFGAHLRALIWELSFTKMLSSIFSPEKCVPNRS